MLFDTHCHLNFEAFDGRLDNVIKEAKKAGVNNIVIPGTDITTSKKGILIAEEYEGIYVAVGVHPHHVYEVLEKSKDKVVNYDLKIKNLVNQVEELLTNKKVIAIGEVGIDKHIYRKTKYPDYEIEREFIKIQKTVLKKQIKLALEHDKSIILHSREAKEDTLEVIHEVWDKKLEGRIVFHCCEPDEVLLNFAKDHKIFIGVDGDITYYKEKQIFIKKVPLNMLVLETDSPFLNPEPFRTNEGGTGNSPKNIKFIAEYISALLKYSLEEFSKQTTENAKKLFKV